MSRRAAKARTAVRDPARLSTVTESTWSRSIGRSRQTTGMFRRRAAGDLVVGLARGHDDQPVDVAGGEGLQDAAFAGRILVGAAGEDEDAALEWRA